MPRQDTVVAGALNLGMGGVCSWSWGASQLNGWQCGVPRVSSPLYTEAAAGSKEGKRRPEEALGALTG